MPPSVHPRTPPRTPGRWLPLWLAGLGVSLTLALAATLMDHLLQLRQDHEAMAIHELQAAQLGERILTLDEILSSSALLAATTGEAHWQRRHASHAAELEATLQAVLTLAPGGPSLTAAQQTSEANETLIGLEDRAFAAVTAGRLDQARELLESPAYTRAKEAYAWGMQRFTQALRERADAALAGLDAHMTHGARTTTVVLAGLGAVWLWISVLGLRQLRRTRRLRLRLSRTRGELASAGLSRARCLEDTATSLSQPLRRVLETVGQMRGGRLQLDQRERLDVVDDAARGALSVLDDVVDLARLEERQLQLASGPLDPAACVRHAADGWAVEAAERGLALRTFVGVDCPSLVRGDERRLTQVVGHLIGRAVRATEQGSVSVHVNGRSSGTGRCRVRITIRDTGPSLGEDERARLFTPFRDRLEDQADHRPGSLALRLAIGHRLVTLMGGQLVADTGHENGTALWLDLPCEQLAPPRPPAPPEQDPKGDLPLRHDLQARPAEPVGGARSDGVRPAAASLTRAG